jgi:integrase
MTLFKEKSGRWWVRFRSARGIIELSTRQTNRQSAEKVVEMAKIKEIELLAMANVLQMDAIMQVLHGHKLTSLDAVEKWLAHLRASKLSANTVSNYESDVRKFWGQRNWASLWSVDEIALDEFINPKPAILHASTLACRRAALGSFFTYCNAQGWCRNLVPLTEVKLENLSHEQKEPKERRPFTKEEWEKLITEVRFDRWWYPALMIARYTGLRWGDVCALEWASVKTDTLVVWTQKRNKRIEIPIAPELRPVFETADRNRPTVLEPMYPSETGEDAWRRIRKRAQLPKDLCLHCLRHTYAVSLLESGLPIEEIQKRMGHFSMGMTAKYLHIDLPSPWAMRKAL